MSKVLSKDELNKNMDLLSNSWSIEGLYLKGSYSFNNFDNAFSFMKEVAVKCEEMNHHPKWTNVYNKLDIELYTHDSGAVSYTHLRAHETVLDLVCRLLLEKKKKHS